MAWIIIIAASVLIGLLMEEIGSRWLVATLLDDGEDIEDDYWSAIEPHGSDSQGSEPEARKPF